MRAERAAWALRAVPFDGGTVLGLWKGWQETPRPSPRSTPKAAGPRHSACRAIRASTCSEEPLGPTVRGRQLPPGALPPCTLVAAPPPSAGRAAPGAWCSVTLRGLRLRPSQTDPLRGLAPQAPPPPRDLSTGRGLGEPSPLPCSVT